MKTSSAKAKGRKLQQWVRDLLVELSGLTPRDIKSTSMGAGGEDIQFSEVAWKMFPFSIECKNVEKLNVWEAWKQAKANTAEDSATLLVIKRNGQEPLVVADAENFFKEWREFMRLEEEKE